MITLDRDQLTNILAENINLFSNFPVVENYCNIHNLPQGSEGFRRLTQEIEASKDLYGLIARCISSEFKIDKDNFIIENGFQLSSLIAQKKVEISDGEKTWIQNIEKIEEALKGACCSTRHASRKIKTSGSRRGWRRMGASSTCPSISRASRR